MTNNSMRGWLQYQQDVRRLTDRTDGLQEAYEQNVSPAEYAGQRTA